MTNKEWKKLCKWAKNLKNNKVLVYGRIENNIVKYSYISVGYDYTQPIEIYQNGSIYTTLEYDGLSTIAENRTAQQIKTIIKNLL